MRTTFLLLTLLLIAVSACGPTADAPLPTVIELPTQPTAIGLISSATPSDTPIPTLTATASQSATITQNATLTVTPSLTITNTNTPVPTETPLPTLEPGPLDEWGEEFFETVTVLPPVINGTPGYITTYGFVPTLFATNAFGTPIGGGNATLIPLPGTTPIAVSCATPPTGGFGALYQSDPTIPINLGCPLSANNLNRAGALQLFQFGFMIWIEGNPSTIWVFYADGIFTRYFDTFVEGVDPISGGETPPSNNLFEPIRGFGKLWRTTPDVRSRLGWATLGIESPSPAITLEFERGLMLSLQPARSDLLILTSANGNASGVWRSVSGTP
ncbi:MAG: hypothetical protein MUF87_14605 [Anaerolineae bacterium]|nr:hypothetical protein [Anaerolineae bacterium]